MKPESHGFSLIELVIVVAIVAIVTVWGYSSYRDTLLKARRSEGRTELLMIADKLERYFSDQGSYASARLGTSSNAVHTLSSENGYYNFNITNATDIEFTVTATPQGTQANDRKCGTFTLNSNGRRQASGSPGDGCW